jgi:stearoyl-CoA desaturase (delta-9 desaturase)
MRKVASGKLNSSLKDVESMASLLMSESKTSLPMAGRIIGKLIAVSVVGFTLASNHFSHYLVPVGVLFLAISAGWLDAIGNECFRQRFFPAKTLNSIGATLFRWQWIALWTSVLYTLSSMGVVSFLEFSPRQRLWKVSMMAVVPLSLMLLGRALEPFRFKRARADIQKAEILVRRLAATETAADISALAPLIEHEKIPLYKLGSIAKLLNDFVAGYDATEKLSLDLAQVHGSAQWTLKKLPFIIFAPFRRIASDLLLWQSRDIVIYVVAAMYMVAVYVGSFYFPWTPLCVLVPFMGPKSVVGRYVRAAQENIRLAQGRQAEKKGGLAPAENYEAKPIVNWPMLIYICLTHVAAFYAVLVVVAFGGVCPLFGGGQVIKPKTFIWAFFLYVIGGLGITAGVHRLWSHRSYKAGAPLRMLLMIFNSVANQGTIYHWARDHRLHHLYSDTDADPHDANLGFWYSHVTWLFWKKNKAVLEAGAKINMADLKADPIVMFQKRADPFWNLFWCFGLPSFVCLQWGDSLWNGFLVAGAFKYAFTLNATWAVNSVVHAWGSRPYNASHLTTENGWVSLFAHGEGWHNWHHAFSWDYAASELGPLQQWNPTKVFIDGMALFGLAWDRKRATDVWKIRKQRWEESMKRPVVESLEGPPLFKHRVTTFGPQEYGADDAPAQYCHEDDAPADSQVEACKQD